MIASVAGEIEGGALTSQRPFRSPHHSASMAALTGGGIRAKPGEISLAHHGVLFLDELPEFDPRVLDSLRQPLENGEVAVSRANHRVTYPARFMLVSAMNPCRCGHAFEPGYACKRGPIDRCTSDYQMRISGPLMDRIDLRIEVPAVTRRRSDPAAAGGRFRRSRGPRRGCARHSTGALRGRRTHGHSHQCGSAGSAAGRDRKAGYAGTKAVARCRRHHAIVGARLSSRAPRRADARRPGWRREDRPAASGRGAVLPRARRRRPPRGVRRPSTRQ